jgi:murein DD-endopeptidase MepM/ murein hydrolase activator NlpD
LTTATARAIAYSAVALLALGALSARPPQAPHAKPAALLANASAASAPETRRLPSWVQHEDTLGRGESLGELFERLGVSAQAALAALRETPDFDDRRVPAGLAVTSRNLDTDSLPSEIVLQFGVDRRVRLHRTSDGWLGAEERLPWTTDTAAVSATVTSTLYGALDAAADSLLPARLRAELAWTIADILEYRVDMSRDLQPGDGVRVLFERSTTASGAVRMGRVLAVRVEQAGDTLEAIRFGAESGKGHYYDARGRSLRAAFLRAPLEFRRISSVFGMRKHPILKTWRAHRGTDYAAASGTPVRAIGDGVVSFAGRRSGYGNVLEVRHSNGYVSRYAHLRGFARGGRRGARVGIGETIGYVGMTGLATAPHLHFEVLVGGRQQDPRVALRDKSGMPIEAGERSRFQRQRAGLLAAFAPPSSGTTRLASASD